MLPDVPTNKVPHLPPGYFFRVVKTKCEYYGDTYKAELREKRRIFGSYVVETAQVETNAADEITEYGILSAMKNALRYHEATQKRCSDKAEKDRRNNKFLGDYPPKRI